jgi:hypothetical protein
VTAKPWVRPTPGYALSAKPYVWRNEPEPPLNGVVVHVRGSIVQWLTPEQAINLADQLVDAVEQYERTAA